jgi:hypothetical protein
MTSWRHSYTTFSRFGSPAVLGLEAQIRCCRASQVGLPRGCILDGCAPRVLFSGIKVELGQYGPAKPRALRQMGGADPTFSVHPERDMEPKSG